MAIVESGGLIMIVGRGWHLIVVRVAVLLLVVPSAAATSTITVARLCRRLAGPEARCLRKVLVVAVVASRLDTHLLLLLLGLGLSKARLVIEATGRRHMQVVRLLMRLMLLLRLLLIDWVEGAKRVLLVWSAATGC